MIVRKTTPQEGNRVNDLFAIAFELPKDVGPGLKENLREHCWAAFDEDGSMMSTFTITDFQMQFDGHSCKMGGVGGVATLPQYRRMGGIRGCFEACLPDLYREGYDFSYLYPFSTGYYRKFGFECCVQHLLMRVDLALLKPGRAEGKFHLCEADHPYLEAIQAVDAYWESHYNMMVIHEDSDYDWAGKFDPAGNLTFTYVYLAPDGTPKGYTTFQMENQADGRNLQCSKFFFTDREGFDGLMMIFKSLSSDHRFVKFTLPAGEGLEYLCPEWAMGAAMWSVQNAGMVRVINAESVLRKASYHGSGSLNLRILDPHIPENDHCYHVAFIDGKADAVEITQDAPDVTVTMPAFSALISGAGNPTWVSGVDIHRDNMGIYQIFHKKPMMIADYF